MDDDELLKRLRKEIESDLTPVRPLRSPWLRALLPVAAGVAFGCVVILATGFRPDIDVVGTWRLLGFTFVQAMLCAGLLVTSLRWSIPAMSGSPWTALAWASGALLVQVLIARAVLERSSLAPLAGAELRTGLACLSAITVVALAPLGAGIVLLQRGLVTRLHAAFALTGFASGLAAEAMWRLHCPYSNWMHVLLFHWGSLVAAVLVALAVATYVVRRAASPTSHPMLTER